MYRINPVDRDIPYTLAVVIWRVWILFGSCADVVGGLEGWFVGGVGLLFLPLQQCLLMLLLGS